MKNNGLIEGVKPNYHISAKVAKGIGGQADYMKQSGIDDVYCKKKILDYLSTFKQGKKEDFEKILLDKLPDVLVILKKNQYNLQSLIEQGIIEINGKMWVMSKTKK